MFIDTVAAAIFAVALLHTFCTRYFEKLAHTRPAHAGMWHWLAEVEVVFGLWASVLLLVWGCAEGAAVPLAYLDSRSFTEPLFVLAIMVLAASRPVLQAAHAVVTRVAQALPLSGGMAWLFTVLTVVPLLGSFITEPAAMTLAALLLRDSVFAQVPQRLRYAVLGVLLVNVSIGGTLTPYAAPPVLMVAQAWGLDLAYMWGHIGSKAVVAVLVNSAGLCLLFARDWRALPAPVSQHTAAPVPTPVVLLHLGLLAGMVVLAHHPAAFLGLLLWFLGIATAYPQHQQRLLLREGLLVAFFLAGLVVLGGLQQWWLQPLLTAMTDTQIYWGALALTAFTDNAALTYLGSLVPGLSPGFKHALLTGAVAGGGLTLVANAPNPAAAALLKHRFDQGVVGAGGLFAAALLPTLVATACFRGWLGWP